MLYVILHFGVVVMEVLKGMTDVESAQKQSRALFLQEVASFSVSASWLCSRARNVQRGAANDVSDAVRTYFDCRLVNFAI
jgi:hypothetical protein